MKRRSAREFVLQFLYRVDFVPDTPIHLNEDLERFWSEAGEVDADVRNYASEVIRGTVDHIFEIDPLIQKTAEKWNLVRMAAVDRNILRFATYEILFRPDIPNAVSMDEAIEVAKKYSTSDSAAFINGILDRIAKEHGQKDQMH